MVTFSLGCNKKCHINPQQYKKNNFSSKKFWMHWEVAATENGVPQVTVATEVETL